MGRRKGRKLAAMSAAGRKVKLDLFAEPAGDLGGSSARDEVGGKESKVHAESPNSPSSSGQQQENPLMLLGQYSDDEVDEESSGLKRAASEDTSFDQGRQAAKEDNSVNGENGSTVLNGEEQAVDNGSDLPSPSDRAGEDSTKERIVSDSFDLDAQTNVMEQTALEAAQVVGGDAGSLWKTVLDEESNQYYYWNIVTGETLWEVPKELSQAAGPELEEEITECMGRNNESSANLNIDVNVYGKPIEDTLHDSKGDNDEGRSGKIIGSEHIEPLCNGTSGSLSGQSSDAQFNRSGEDSTKYRNGRGDYVERNETEADFSSDLVKYCERLLEQLKAMKGSECCMQLNDQILKYAFELEIRLADIRSLACNGLSLLPFWVHSERKIKLLDSEINQICGRHSNVREAGHEFHGGRNDVDNSNQSDPATSGKGGASGEELIPQTVAEVDMDVDMEDEGAKSNTPNQAPPLDTSSLSVLQEKLESSQICTAPPLDEYWIPPPPPDNELSPPPPPPPDEPPLDVLSSDVELVQSFPYNFAYPGSTFEYYVQTDPQVATYATSESQIAANQQPLFYQIPSTFSVAINHADYYGHQDGTLQPVSAVSGAETSTLSAIPVQENSGIPSLPKIEVNHWVTEQASYNIPATQSSSQGAVGSVAVSSTSAVAASASTAPSKVQSKVTCNKKRAAGKVATLRSNKKVSSLVDKWKAAKEELHAAEEEESESALEKLEKKRQREIEEWRSQQIASGEAKDNANFQPLGSDWRERVKRKRAETMKAAEKRPSEEKEHPPDLNVLSRGLPSGWQAYWDDSTKQVYYGNIVTSETTWNRPTDKIDSKNS